MKSTAKQANFLLPEELLEELRNSVPKREQSKVVAEAVRRELKRLRLLKAIETSFGTWRDEDHESNPVDRLKAEVKAVTGE